MKINKNVREEFRCFFKWPNWIKIWHFKPLFVENSEMFEFSNFPDFVTLQLRITSLTTDIFFDARIISLWNMTDFYKSVILSRDIRSLSKLLASTQFVMNSDFIYQSVEKPIGRWKWSGVGLFVLSIVAGLKLIIEKAENL